MQRAPSLRKKPLLLIPDGAFEGGRRDLRGRIESAWAPARVADDASRARPGGVLVLVSDEPPDLLAERTLRWAADERMSDRLLLVVAAGVPVRSDLPARLLEAGGLAGVSVLSIEPTELHTLAERLGAFARALGSADRDQSIVEIDSGSVWYF